MRLSNISSRRRGSVTVIVVAFLALLLVLGLSFAFYALRESEESRVYRDSVNGGATGVTPVSRGSSGTDAPPEPDAIVNSALASVIYGAPDDLTGAFNSLRTHEMSRGAYGWNPKFPSPYWPYNVPAPLTFDPSRAGTQPFNGYGRVSPATVLSPTMQPPAPNPIPENTVNWTWITDPALLPLLTPYFMGQMCDPDNNYRRDPRAGSPVAFSYTPAGPGGGTDRYWAKNANYTYPDTNNFFLAALDPKSGKVLVPSYYRPWLVNGPVPPNPEREPKPRTGPTAATLTPGDPNDWINATGRLVMLRPRPVDHQWPPGSGLSDFRYPEVNAIDGSVGDVELLEGKPIGRYLDAMWTDLDLPVRTWRGKNYKPLVAFLIFDLDGRINLNTAGNFQVVPGTEMLNPPQIMTGSDQGVGPWEVNPSQVLLNYPQPPNPPGPFPNPAEAAGLVLGTLPAPGMVAHNRYGQTWVGVNPSRIPLKPFTAFSNERLTPNTPPPGNGAHFYGGVDYFSVVRQGQGGQYSASDLTGGYLTGYTWGPGYDGTPILPPALANPPRPHMQLAANQPLGSLFDNGMYVVDSGGNVLYDERSNHPSLLNPYLVRTRAAVNLAPGLGSNIPNRIFGVEEMRFLNAKYNFDDYSRSQMAALAPSTLGNPAFRSQQLNSRFAVTSISHDFDLPGAAPWLSALKQANYQVTQQPPPPGQIQAQPTGQAVPLAPLNPSTLLGDYDDAFRARLSAVGPVDLNRKLTDYRMDTMHPLGPNNVGNVQRAIADRQLLAHDIFFRLCLATGVMTGPTFNPTAGDPTQRWLAQLAVNIVDFIDTDDCITPFKWTDPTGGGPDDLTNSTASQQALNNYQTLVQGSWVFGFERPRVVINEAYLRVENDPTDPLKNAAGAPAATMDFNMLMWLELHNPVTPANQAEQFSGIEGYYLTPNPPNPVADDNVHGGYRAALADKFATGSQSVYRALVSRIPMGAAADPMGMLQPTNVAGIPSTGVMTNSQTAQPQVLVFNSGGSGVSDTRGNSKGQMVIEPNFGGQYMAQDAFFLAGPTGDQQGMGGGPAQAPQGGTKISTANVTSSMLMAKVKFQTEWIAITHEPTWSPGFVLQRLACPALPPGPQNPYVTTDYWESNPVAVNDRLKYEDAQGTTLNMGNPPDWNKTYAYGRRQPYDGVVQYPPVPPANGTIQAPGDKYAQQPQGALADKNQINWTFGQHNGTSPQQSNTPAKQGDATLELPFRPLAHYDRILLNPTELFHVVANRPHELTHNFFGAIPPITPNSGLDPNGRLRYTADWLDHGRPPNVMTPQSVLLYRALDLLRTPSMVSGLGMGGRVPGKININTIFTPEIFTAICDAQPANRFNQTGAEVTSAWNALIASRQPGGAGTISQTDQPFRGTALALDPTAQTDRRQTVVRPDMLWQQSAGALPFGTNRQLENYTMGPAPGGGHASDIEKYEMASKVFNQFTTRSNSFAVYMMIGYFEVKNPGPWNEANRPILGKELGSDDGTITRHKYFAVVDRTNLSIEAPLSVVAPGQTLPPVRQGAPLVYFSYQPNTALPSLQTNPPYALPGTEDPAPNPGQAVFVRVPIVGQPLDPLSGAPIPGQLIGEYDGTLWTIQAGTAAQPRSVLTVDTGDRAEDGPFAVIDAALDPNAPNTGILMLARANPLAVPNMPTGFVKQHSRGAIMRLVNPDPNQPGIFPLNVNGNVVLLPSTMPGNPGPQPGFNYKSPRYASVVKYVEQLK
jgi:hypothetical protein